MPVTEEIILDRAALNNKKLYQTTTSNAFNQLYSVWVNHFESLSSGFLTGKIRTAVVTHSLHRDRKNRG